MRSLVVACALAVAAPAQAETSATSSLAQLMILEPGDASYKLFHGAVWLESDKAQTNYRWGGLQCKGRELSPASVQILFAAFRSEYRITLEYVVSQYKDKQYRCITGFTIARS